MSDNKPTHWEPIDARRMFGVFDNIGYSPDPIALFRSEQDAKEWLDWDESRGDDQTVCCDTCILPTDIDGRVWNNLEPVVESEVAKPIRLDSTDIETLRWMRQHLDQCGARAAMELVERLIASGGKS